ncbi:MAG: hypothetical protein IJ598_11640 [Ruminococcus sp.]|nr:hypothetical protein [Ruminococcus sp.]
MKKIISLCLAAAMTFGTAAALHTAAAEKVKMGDADLNGVVNIVDATEIQRYLTEAVDFNATQKAVADVDKSNKIEIADVTMIQRIAADFLTMDEEIEAIPEQPFNLTPAQVREQGNAGVNDFSVRLLQSSVNAGQNTMVSPLSVLYALGMTANGAKGSTLSQMEKTIGMKRDLLNHYLKAYPSYNRESYSAAKLNLANSLWYNTNAAQTVSDSFSSTVSQYYDAEIHQTAFNQAALNDINGWVKKETDGMIPSVLDEINPQMLMYLINAVAFDAEWNRQYDPMFNVHPDTFTAENGETADVEMMSSPESWLISDDNAQGFVKYFSDSNYAFAALLPDENVKLGDYVNSLTGEKLTKVLDSERCYENLYAYLPKFELSYSENLKDNLAEMGMPDAFVNGAANFLDMVDAAPSPYISSVIHKTYIDVNERGTRAGAVTVIGMEAGSTPDEDSLPPITIRLDRPFLYMIINTNTNTPLFIGTVENLS